MSTPSRLRPTSFPRSWPIPHALLAAALAWPCGTALAATPERRGAPEADPDPGESEPGHAGDLAHAHDDPSFGPRYLIEAIVVTGNRRTNEWVIRSALGLAPGEVVAASDPRVEAARLRLLSLGYFLDVRLSLARGARRGGAVLTVTVEERGTLVLTGLFLGASEATDAWGGLELAETNFLGRGFLLQGGFVQSSTPEVAGAEAGTAVRLRAAGPIAGPGSLQLAGSVLASNGSEFFRATGTPDEADPKHYVPVNTSRFGGTLGFGADISRTARVRSDLRWENVRAELPGLRSLTQPDGRTEPIDFHIREGGSRIASIAVGFEVDTRNDLVLPRAGRRLSLSMETALPVFGSSYTFAKGVVQASSYHQLGWQEHTFGIHAFVGAIFGDAPYFDRFFIGDLNPLLPQRSLGLNFSTRPSPDLLGTPIAQHRYDAYAGRLLFEYAVPLLQKRRSGFVYRGDAFVAFGAFAVASENDLRRRDEAFWRSVPFDFTADLGIRLDTYIGIFNLSVGNALGRIPL